MESDANVRECKNCHHDVIGKGKIWNHVKTSLTAGGDFKHPGIVSQECQIDNCTCKNPEPM